jgi:hypothetical protein
LARFIGGAKVEGIGPVGNGLDGICSSGEGLVAEVAETGLVIDGVDSNGESLGGGGIDTAI